MRMASQTARIEAGFVHVPAEAHWLADYLHELSVFPNGRYDDQVDSTSQALEWMIAPWVKGLAFLELAREINRKAGLARLPPERKTEWAKGCMEWQAEQDLLAQEEAKNPA